MVTTRKATPKAPAKNRSATPQAVAKPTAKKTAPKAVKKVAAPKTTAPQTVTPKASPAPVPKAEKKAKPEKIKVVRDSFTIPKSEYAAIADMKKRAMVAGKEVKKSELLRAGLMLLATASDSVFAKALAQVPALKTGRPGKG